MLDILNIIPDWKLLCKIVALILTITQQRRLNISIFQISKVILVSIIKVTQL